MLQESGALATWSEKMEFPVKYRDLPMETQLAFTVWHFTELEGNPIPLGGATMKMFSKKGRLKTVRREECEIRSLPLLLRFKNAGSEFSARLQSRSLYLTTCSLPLSADLFESCATLLRRCIATDILFVQVTSKP